MPAAKRLIFLGALSSAVALVTVAVLRYHTPPPAGHPVLKCPAVLNLGEREFGEVAVGRFQVTNRGAGELLLDRFRTSCSCAGVEVEQDGEFRRVESVRLGSREQKELAVRIAVGARPGTHQLVIVGFATNDPARPEAVVEVFIPRVKGGAYPQPTAVMFGEIPVGSEPRQVVRLYDNGVASRRVGRVRSSQPDRFEVRLLEPTGLEAEETHETAGRLMALLEVTPCTEHPGRLDGTVEVELAGEKRPADSIPVLGEVVLPVVCRPSCLVLPRTVSGRQEFTGQVAIASRDGRAVAVAIEESPSGLSAAVRPDPADPACTLLDVTCTPETRDGSKETREVRVRLRVTPQGDAAFGLEIPVTLLGAAP
jgi:hypothetical protein